MFGLFGVFTSVMFVCVWCMKVFCHVWRVCLCACLRQCVLVCCASLAHLLRLVCPVCVHVCVVVVCMSLCLCLCVSVYVFACVVVYVCCVRVSVWRVRCVQCDWYVSYVRMCSVYA